MIHNMGSCITQEMKKAIDTIVREIKRPIGMPIPRNAPKLYVIKRRKYISRNDEYFVIWDEFDNMSVEEVGIVVYEAFRIAKPKKKNYIVSGYTINTALYYGIIKKKDLRPPFKWVK